MANYQPKKTTVLPKPDLKGAVVHLEGEPDANGVISDLSGNSNDGTTSGKLLFYNNSEEIVWESHGDTDPEILISDSASINDNPAQTFQFFFNPRSNGESNEGRIFDKGAYYAYFDGTDVNFHQGFSGTQGQWSFPVPQGFWSFVQITYDKSDVANDPVAYVNGVSVTVTENQAPVGTYTTDVGSDLYLFERAANDRAFDGEIANFKLYPSALSTDDLDDEYDRFALPRMIRHTPRTEFAVTTAPVAAPNQVGPWMTWAGSHEWLDDGTDRYISHDTLLADSFATLQSCNSYGAWYFKYRNDGTANKQVIIFALANDADADYNGANQTGYYLLKNVAESLALRRMNGGGTTFLASGGTTLLDSLDMEFFITRRVTDGQFTIYMRSSNYPTWTQVIQHIDNTYTSCNYMQHYNDNGGIAMEIKNVISWPYGDTLTPNDVPFLAD